MSRDSSEKYYYVLKSDTSNIRPLEIEFSENQDGSYIKKLSLTSNDQPNQEIEIYDKKTEIWELYTNGTIYQKKGSDFIEKRASKGRDEIMPRFIGSTIQANSTVLARLLAFEGRQITVDEEVAMLGSSSEQDHSSLNARHTIETLNSASPDSQRDGADSLQMELYPSNVGESQLPSNTFSAMRTGTPDLRKKLGRGWATSVESFLKRANNGKTPAYSPVPTGGYSTGYVDAIFDPSKSLPKKRKRITPRAIGAELYDHADCEHGVSKGNGTPVDDESLSVWSSDVDSAVSSLKRASDDSSSSDDESSQGTPPPRVQQRINTNGTSAGVKTPQPIRTPRRLNGNNSNIIHGFTTPCHNDRKPTVSASVVKRSGRGDPNRYDGPLGCSQIKGVSFASSLLSPFDPSLSVESKDYSSENLCDPFQSVESIRSTKKAYSSEDLSSLKLNLRDPVLQEETSDTKTASPLVSVPNHRQPLSLHRPRRATPSISSHFLLSCGLSHVHTDTIGAVVFLVGFSALATGVGAAGVLGAGVATAVAYTGVSLMVAGSVAMMTSGLGVFSAAAPARSKVDERAAMHSRIM